MTGATSVLPSQAVPSIGGAGAAIQASSSQFHPSSSSSTASPSTASPSTASPSTAAMFDLQQQQHPKGKAAVGGQSHAHRPVSAMPAPRTGGPSPSQGQGDSPQPAANRAIPAAAAAAGGTAAAAFANIVNSQPYTDRRNSAHPVLINAPSSRPPGAAAGAGTSTAIAAAAASGGIDAQTAQAILSHGIPITSPAAMQYFAAHPRRQQVHFGNYLLLQTLGEGEFGKVKLGVHKEWGEEVAVKLIKRDRVASSGSPEAGGGGKDPSKMSKVEREIQVLKEVRHPNIVRLYEVIESDRYIGIVLEYASGGELFDHILAHKYLREKDACRLFAQLISGVHYLHQKQIIHRDLKLENLLLDRNRNVIITDFGFANNFGDKRNDLMATSCGSPCYAAPELVVQDGLYAGSAVDVWSCGVILYAMLAGYLPFDDDPANPDGDNINLLYKYIMATPLSFPDYITAEPRSLLSRMLVPDPLKRADLQQVMRHSWLAAYRDLFTFSVDDLERAAIEQQAKKRQVYRQQMMLQHQIQEQQQQQRDAAKHALQRGDSVREVSSSDATASPRAQRHQSAMPSTMAPPSTTIAVPGAADATPTTPCISSAGGTSRSGAPPEAAAAATAAARGGRAYDPVTAQGDARGEPRSRISLEGDHAALSPSTSATSATATATSTSTPRKSAVASAQREREPQQQRKPAAQKTQRHTIQLEYTGGDQAQQQKRKKEHAQPAPPSPAADTIAKKIGQSPATTGASPTKSLSTPSASGFAPILPASAAAHVAASPVAVPGTESTADWTVASTGPVSVLGADINVPSPIQEQQSSPLPQTATSTSTSAAAVTPKPTASAEQLSQANTTPAPISDALATTRVPCLDAAANSNNNNNNERRGSRIVSDSNARHASKVSLASRTNIGAGGPPHAASTGAATDSSSDKISARHRKGLSRDNSFFSRLLSGSHGQNGLAAPPSSTSISIEPSASDDGRGGARVVSNASTTGSGKSSSSYARRKAMSLVVSRFGDANNSPANKDRELATNGTIADDAKSERRFTGRLRAKDTNSDSQRVPLTLTVSNSGSAFRQSVIPRPRQRQPQVHQDEDLDEGATTMGSTNAAKKVMDWFRKKSLAKGTFDEQPPLGPFERLDQSGGAPRVVVTASGPSVNGSAAAAAPVPTPARSAQNESSGPSSRSTSGTHSYLSHDTHTTADSQSTGVTNATTVTNASTTQPRTANKSALPAVEDSNDTPRVSATGVDGLGLPQQQLSSTVPFDDTILRQHVGAVDQTALTSLPPPDILARVREALTSMGIDFRLASGEDFKLECLRQKRTAKALQGIGSSIRTSVFPPSQAEIERSSKPPSSPMSPSMSSAGSIRNFLRRGSSQQSGIMQTPSVGAGSGFINGNSSNTNSLPTLYGEASVDGGQEVRFSVEITKIKNLPGLYSLDIRRMRGNVWAYKFCYTALLQRCNLSGQGIAL
ncbi:Pkinase-domain-containing protein [Tilletiaria anomala UBC 951]|uniref:non-specific serine/threonine protein kinase n=1 Tax=Tilletiaria anomala (strain ATCC 24038 / CBS 436.72 / UBC 951) TaxID=1037660 RepID=A0A066WA62_TILAU|nr:Pkinase-domain-containing protein [Tilletiaria anomala UBC 951]KDN47959.1 Pkinase-domain-containing protein [Tilletiaria anomala UBC 951]